jgi:uncharacterized protein YbjT (DUF2867 family)
LTAGKHRKTKELNMTVLVMDATGNVGGAIVRALREREVGVTAISRHERQWPSGVQGFVADPNAAGVDERLPDERLRC